MCNRVANAVERAGRLDRAHRQIEHAQQEAGKAIGTLQELDPETAAIIAQVIMLNDRALARLARL